MKKTNRTESKIFSIIEQNEAGGGWTTCAGRLACRRKPHITGEKNTMVWTAVTSRSSKIYGRR